MEFNALDLIPIPDKRIFGEEKDLFTAKEINGMGEVFDSHKLSDFLGVGIYNTFIHTDTRGLIGRQSPARRGSNR